MMPPWGRGWGAPSWIFRLQAVGGATGHLVHGTQEENMEPPTRLFCPKTPATSRGSGIGPRLSVRTGGTAVPAPRDIPARSVRLQCRCLARPGAEVDGLRASRYFQPGRAAERGRRPLHLALHLRPPWSVSGSCCKAVVRESLRGGVPATESESQPGVQVGHPTGSPGDETALRGDAVDRMKSGT